MSEYIDETWKWRSGTFNVFWKWSPLFAFRSSISTDECWKRLHPLLTFFPLPCFLFLHFPLVECGHIYVEGVWTCQSISCIQAGSRAGGQMAGRAQPPWLLTDHYLAIKHWLIYISSLCRDEVKWRPWRSRAKTLLPGFCYSSERLS